MEYLDLITNLALLVALCVISGFVDRRWSRESWVGAGMQGVLFGMVVIIGMLRPLILGPGLIFDGRTVMLSLCALFFGPRAIGIACLMALVCRASIGGAGIVMGLATILSSSVIGLAAHYLIRPWDSTPSTGRLYVLGLIVHSIMVALMFTLPGEAAWSTFKRLALAVILLYPLATILAGKILADALSTIQAAAIIRESEERYRLLFDAGLDAVLLTAPDGKILSANPAACSLFGRTERELIALGREGIVDTTDPRLIPALEERQKTGKFHGELRFKRADGSTFDGEISSSFFHNRHGEIQNGMVIRDVSQRKKIEQELIKEKNFNQTLVEHSPVFFVAIRPDGKTLMMNQSMLSALGYTRAEVIGADYIRTFVPESDRHNVEEVFYRLIRYSMPTINENYVLAKDGGRILVEWHGLNIVAENGDIDYFIGVGIDVTQRKTAEDALADSEALYRKLFEDHSAVKLLIDPDTGTIVDANQAAETFYGWPRQTIKRMKISEINTLSAEEIKNQMEAARLSGRNHFEFQHRRASGDIRDVEVFSSRIGIKGKDYLHSIIHDITDRRRAEEEISRLNVELEKKVDERTRELRDSQLALLNIVDDLNETTGNLAAANASLAAVNKELAAFSYSVSHDLRAPLRNIEGFSNALSEDCGAQLSDDGRLYLERIRLATQTMRQLIDDLLSLSRVTQTPLERKDVDLSALAQEIAGLVQSRSACGSVVVEIHEGMHVQADLRLVEIAMTNLLENAWKFTSKISHPHVWVGCENKDDETVYFVRDNGAGFDRRYANKLFGAFQRLHRAEDFPGTGIGLATVQRIIHRHGGRIWAEGEVGKGATFYFTLPE